MSLNKRPIPDKTELFYTDSGFGVKRISKETIKANLPALRQILKEAKAQRERRRIGI